MDRTMHVISGMSIPYAGGRGAGGGGRTCQITTRQGKLQPGGANPNQGREQRAMETFEMNTFAFNGSPTPAGNSRYTP